MLRDYSSWELIDEEMVETAAAMAAEEGSNDATNFHKILVAGEVFRYAGLTPIFVYDNDTARMAVYAEEFHFKKILIN